MQTMALQVIENKLVKWWRRREKNRSILLIIGMLLIFQGAKTARIASLPSRLYKNCTNSDRLNAWRLCQSYFDEIT